MMDLVNANVSVRIDKVSGITHNKVIIIDEQKVITGSFNFTNAADKRNAENVIIINNKSVAKEYLNNWQKRYAKNYAK
jgi:phospholipase D